jgi:hypothetical protein
MFSYGNQGKTNNVFYKIIIDLFLTFLLTKVKIHDKVLFVEKISTYYTEAYPSLAEGIGLENRQAG